MIQISVGWLVGWCLTSLSTIFQLYRGVRFIGGEHRRTRRIPPTCRKSLTNFMDIGVNNNMDMFVLSSNYASWLPLCIV